MLPTIFKKGFLVWLVFSSMSIEASSYSFHQPHFCPFATWKTNAITWTNIAVLQSPSYVLFIDTNDTIYATNTSSNSMFVWAKHNQTPSIVLAYGSAQPAAVFVTHNGDILVDNGALNKRVDKWTLNSSNIITTSTTVMLVGATCFALFVDNNNTLYCSIHSQHQVLTTSLNSTSNTTTRRAGNGTGGSAAYLLQFPAGIFVDTNYDLYVADWGNDRVQVFGAGETNATTVAGNGTTGTIVLRSPVGVLMDGDGYLFIVEWGNHRIVRGGPQGYECVVGCTGRGGSSASELNRPTSMGFDSAGNIFVMDYGNTRIQTFLLAQNSCISYNLPKLSPCARWAVNGITFANETIVGVQPRGIFVDRNDTFYFSAYNSNRTLIWDRNSTLSVRNLASSLFRYTYPFVTDNGDIYFENGNATGRIEKWSINTTISVFVAHFTSSCYGLFIDLNHTVYCSLRAQSQVVAFSLISNVSRVVAGNGTAGSTSVQLNKQYAIVVDMSFNVYVADTENDRIQLFRRGQRNGTTVAGNGTPNNLVLNHPTDVVLDRDGYLFIADNEQNRIVRVGINDYSCVAGCSGVNGSAANQLSKPYSVRFDSNGHLFVADEFNNRIQKFLLASNTCGASIGPTCNVSNTPCDVMQPCQNNGTCMNSSTSLRGYYCSCPPYFDGNQCQLDHRPCKPFTCLNNGTCPSLPHCSAHCPGSFAGSCTSTSNSTYLCQCARGWEGDRCERKIDQCVNVTCQNRGVCRVLVGDYACECLHGSYSGDHCQIRGSGILARQIASKSFAYISAITIVGVFGFVAFLDALKYGFGIDPVKEERDKIQQQKRPKKRRQPVVVRFIYINAVRPSNIVA